MGTITRSHTFVAGEKPTDDQWNVDIDQAFTLINGNLDESNVDYSSSDGIVTLQQTQTITGTKTFDAATTFNTSILPDSTGGADMGSASQEWGDVYVADDKFIKFGSDQNVFVGYDETTTDSLKFAATEGAGLAITLMADEGDDAGDEWKLNVADGGTLTLGNDIASAGTYVTGLTITPNSTTAAWLMDFEGDIDVGGDTLSFNGAATIDTSGNNALSLDAGSATLTLDGGTIESDATTLSFDAATTIDTSGNNALSLDAGSAVLTLDGGTIESDASTFSFDGAATIDTSGNNNLTLNAGTGTIVATAGDVTVFDDNNNADVSMSIGTSATEALVVQALNGSSNKTLEELRFTTKTASGTANHGKITFYIDEVEIGTIDDGGIDLASGMTFAINGSDLPSSAGDFSGPGSSTDNAVVRFDGTGGKTAQNSGVVIDDSNNVSGVGTLATTGDVTIFDDANNADTSLSIGTSATEALVVEALNGGSNKTLEELRFTTKTASATGDHGKMSFYIDEAEIATIDDGGIDLASGKSFTVNGSALSSGISWDGSTANGVATYKDGDEATVESNLTFDGTTLLVGTSIAATADTNTSIGLPGSDVLTLSTAGSERMRLSASGQLLIGTNSSLGVSSGTGNGLQLAGDDTFANFAIHSHRSNQYPGVFTMAHSRNSTVGSYTILQDGDALGYIAFAGDDGTDVNSLGAEIWAEVDGEPGEDDMPGRLIFRTTADGAATTTERMRIDSDGAVTIASQPSFNASVGTGIANVTGDATAYTIVFNTEAFDRGADFNTSTGVFTAPVTGLYQLSVSVQWMGVTSGMNDSSIGVTTSNGGFTVWQDSGTTTISANMTHNGAMLEDMDAGDTASVYIDFRNGSKVVDVWTASQFSGALIA